MAESVVKSGVVKKSRKKLVIAIVVIVAVVAVGWFLMLRLQAMAGPMGFEMPETVVLTRTDLESKVTALGNFASADPVSVGSNVQGAEVETVYVEEGSKVYAGDVLARLKTSDIERSITDTRQTISETQRSDRQRVEQAQRAFDDADAQYYADDRQTQKAVDDARAAHASAQKAYDDARRGPDPDPEVVAELRRAVNAAQSALDNAIQVRENTMRASNSRWYDAKAQLDSLQGIDSARQTRSQLETLNENLDNASIVSPITGIVTWVGTEAGKATMGDMFRVENTETLEISANIAEYDVIKIEKGMKANIRSNATGEERYEGVVDFVAPIASDAGGNFAVKVLVTSPIGQLKPGMTATVEIVTAAATDVFAVPIDAVVTKPDGTKVVYVYEPSWGGMTEWVGEDGEGGVSVMFSGDGDRPVMIEGSVDGMGEGPVRGRSMRPEQVGDGPGMTRGGPIMIGGDGAAMGDGRREIVVTTGMETDYYIEIISDELTEGMLILSDPQGRNVRMGGGPMMMGGGAAVSGQAVAVERVETVSVN